MPVPSAVVSRFSRCVACQPRGLTEPPFVPSASVTHWMLACASMKLRWLAGAFLLTSFVPSMASADDCPAGSKLKSEGGFSWCEPSVCLNDGNCSPSEVCRPVPLCVEVGKLDERTSTKDAAQKLVATQRCAPDDTCPSTQTCS